MFALIPGGYEWLIILVVVLLIFGHRIPGMARALGSGITEFKKGLKDGNDKPTLPPPGSPPGSLPGPGQDQAGKPPS